MIHIENTNESYITLKTHPEVLRSLQKYFEITPEGSRFQKYKTQIKLLKMNGTIYKGLLSKVLLLLEKLKYEYTLDPDLIPKTKVPKDFGHTLAKRYNFPHELFDYQNTYIVRSINSERRFLISPTNSGKTGIIYLLSRYFAENNMKTIIVVPNISLIHQLIKDFSDYGYKEKIHPIYEGQEKQKIDAMITVSTWQSITDMDQQWYEQFDSLLGDEGHKMQAKSLIKIISSCTNARYRIGMTGTLKNVEKIRMTIEGLFGPITQTVTQKDLIDRGISAKPIINALILPYAEKDKLQVSKMTYHQEMDFLVTSKARNNYILELTRNLTDTTLILFNYVEKHGEVLYKLLKENLPDRKVYFIAGKVKGENREAIRQQVEYEPGSIIIASFGTYSTGISIKSLKNLIISSPTKSQYTVLQSIGRMLRKMAEKYETYIYDMIDDLEYQGRENYALTHFKERYTIYVSEYFDVKMTPIDPL